MDGARFEALLRHLSDPRSRRELLTRLGVGISTGAAWRQDAEGKSNHRNKKHRHRKRHRHQRCPATCPLCQQCVDGKSCSTVADGTICNGTGTCAQGTCTCVPACTSGCCQDGACLPGDTEVACGEIGQICVACKGVALCDRDVCLDTCGAVVSAGPPARATLTVQDDIGVASIAVIQSLNADTNVPGFTSGTTAPITVTSTKIDQNQPARVVLQIVNSFDGVRRCGATF